MTDVSNCEKPDCDHIAINICEKFVNNGYLFANIFLQERELLDVINVEYGHRCRAEPIEAAIYSLDAKGDGFEKFRAIATAHLTVEIDETSAKQQEKKKDYFSLELPVNFSKEKVVKVGFVFP